MMQLIDKIKNPAPQLPQEINGLACDSRKVKAGDLFVAVTCDEIILHVLDALKNGANAVIIEEEVLAQNKARLPQATYIPVKNARQSLSELAAKIYPDQPKIIMAVTGTNGKTSVVNFIRQIWELLDIRGASFGTLGLETTDNIKFKNLSMPKLTTPDAISLHRLLSNLKRLKSSILFLRLQVMGLINIACTVLR